MPRFFFDTDDGERHFRDETGIDLASPHDVPEEVMGLLRDLAHIRMPIGRRTMSVDVRKENGVVIYRGSMTIVGETIE